MNFYYQEKFQPDEILEYLRKSRADDPNSTVEEVLAKHEQLLSEWEKKNLDSPIPADNIYKEVVSGETIDGRPEIQKILKRIENPKIKAILVVEPQRLSRGDLEDCGRLIKLLRYTNTKVITLTKTYDLTDEHDRESFERELKRGNEYLEYYKKIQARGKLLSVQEGNYIGSVAPYGYDRITIKEGKNKYTTLKINETEAEAVRLIFDMYAVQHIGITDICRKLNAMNYKPRNRATWTYYSISDMLENIHYLGKIKWNWRKQINIVKEQEFITVRPKNKDYYIFDGKHEPIISEELFQMAQEWRGRSARVHYKDRELKNPLASLLFCSCGRAMRLRFYKRKGVVSSAPRYECFEQSFCGSSSILASELIDEVRTALKNQIEDFEVRMSKNDESILRRKEQTIETLVKRLKELEEKELSLWEKYTEESMPKEIFEKLKEKLEHDKSDVQQALKAEQDNVLTATDYSKKIATFTQALNALNDDSYSIEEKNKFLKVCIDRITYSREKTTRAPRGTGSSFHGGWQVAPVQLNIKMKI